MRHAAHQARHHERDRRGRGGAQHRRRRAATTRSSSDSSDFAAAADHRRPLSRHVPPHRRRWWFDTRIDARGPRGRPEPPSPLRAQALTRLPCAGFALLIAAACGGTAVGSSDGPLLVEGSIAFEVYESPVCGDAGPSPLGRCSRETYTGGLQGRGDTAVHSMTPVEPEGLVSITENEVLHLQGGDLHARVNAVYHGTSPDGEFSSMHTIVGGTGRYAGATGFLQLHRPRLPRVSLRRQDVHPRIPPRTMSAWQLGPFAPHPEPLLRETSNARFACPVTGASVAWAAKDVFNPGAVVRDGLRPPARARRGRGRPLRGYVAHRPRRRATDGIRFDLEPEPVLFPADDAWQAWEWPGGCEDPARRRVARRRLRLPLHRVRRQERPASSPPRSARPAAVDQARARLRGDAVREARVEERRRRHRGARRPRSSPPASTGATGCTGARASASPPPPTDLVRWEPVEFDADADRSLAWKPGAGGGGWGIHRVPGAARSCARSLFPRPRRFDSLLVEPGPPALRTDGGHRAPLQRREPPGARRSLAPAVRVPAGPGPVRRRRPALVHRPRDRAVPPPDESATSGRPGRRTSASRRASCCSTIGGSSTTEWPTRASAAPRRRGDRHDDRLAPRRRAAALRPRRDARLRAPRARRSSARRSASSSPAAAPR